MVMKLTSAYSSLFVSCKLMPVSSVYKFGFKGCLSYQEQRFLFVSVLMMVSWCIKLGISVL